MLLALCTSFSSLVLLELKQETENQRVISPVVVTGKENVSLSYLSVAFWSSFYRFSLPMISLLKVEYFLGAHVSALASRAR